MAVLTITGRTAIAQSVFDQTIHLAWGSGSANWNADKTLLREFATDIIDLGFIGVTDLSIASGDGQRIYALGDDYTVDPATGFVARVEGGAIPAGATVATTFRTGRSPAAPTATMLLAEVGRRLVTAKQFCLPDPTGDIVTTTGRYRSSTTPTRHLHLRVPFDYADGGTAVIRETAVFIRTVTIDGLPPGQFYVTPDQVADPGRLLAIEHQDPMPRAPSIRPTLDFVLNF